MGRCLVLVLAVLLGAQTAHAKTPTRVCRKVCAPLIETACPVKGKALRKCRRSIVRDCRRLGVAVCALGLPTGGPGDGTTTPTLPDLPSTTTTTAPVAGGSTTTTTLPGQPPQAVAAVAGAWIFDGTIAERGCGIGASFDAIVSAFSVDQRGSSLTGAMEGVPAAGAVGTAGWRFATLPDCRLVPDTRTSCCLTFSVAVTAFAPVSPADGTATAACDDGSVCESRWRGSVTRADR